MKHSVNKYRMELCLGLHLLPKMVNVRLQSAAGTDLDAKLFHSGTMMLGDVDTMLLCKRQDKRQ